MIKKYLNILFYMFSFIFIYYLLVSGTNYEILPSLLVVVIIFIDIAMYVADEYESSIITEKQKATADSGIMPGTRLQFIHKSVNLAGISVPLLKIHLE